MNTNKSNFAENKEFLSEKGKCHYPMASNLFVAWDRIEVAFRVWESERRHRKRRTRPYLNPGKRVVEAEPHNQKRTRVAR